LSPAKLKLWAVFVIFTMLLCITIVSRVSPEYEVKSESAAAVNALNLAAFVSHQNAPQKEYLCIATSADIDGLFVGRWVGGPPLPPAAPAPPLAPT
jgi:CDP-diglyceride synthetase